MLIDTHCHLDYLDIPEIVGSIPGALQRGRAAGVSAIVVPTVSPANVERVVALADREPEVYFALGIHPMYVQELNDSALTEIENALDRYRHHPKLVAVGEIGLDHYVPGLDRDRMHRFFIAQCTMAKDRGLPVILHVRKAQDQVLAGLRRCRVTQGIAHAFNEPCAGQGIYRPWACAGHGRRDDIHTRIADPSAGCRAPAGGIGAGDRLS